jgi:hypothetical protein
MKWIIRLYALILLAYTGWRTWDFMSQQLPANPSGQILAILFLFATEVGLAIWHETSLRATTHEQEGVAIALTWLDFVGSLGAGVADMILRQSLTAYEVPGWLALLLLYGLPAVVALNVAGALVYLSNDAETQIDKAKSRLRFEITRQALRELHDNRGPIAEKLKPEIYRSLRDDVTGKLESQYVKAAAHPTQAARSGNGKVYGAEVEEVRPNPDQEGSR